MPSCKTDEVRQAGPSGEEPVPGPVSSIRRVCVPQVGRGFRLLH